MEGFPITSFQKGCSAGVFDYACLCLFYVQISEDSTLAKINLPMINVCHKEGFKSKVTSHLLTGMDNHRVFVGWRIKNVSTKDVMEFIKKISYWERPS